MNKLWIYLVLLLLTSFTGAADADAVPETEAVPPDVSYEEPASEPEVTIEPTVIYDENDIKTTAVAFTQDYDYCYLTLEISNNSAEDIDWSVRYVTINDCNVMCAMYCTVSAGATGVEDFWLSTEEMRAYGITEVNEIIAYCEYEPVDDEDAKTVYVEGPVIVTSAGAEFEISLPLEEYPCLYDDNDLKIYYTGVYSSEYDGDLAGLIFCNSSDTAMTVCPTDVSFDGTMNYDNFIAFTVYPQSYSSAYLIGGDLSGVAEAKFRVECREEYTMDDLFTSEYISFQLG